MFSGVYTVAQLITMTKRYIFWKIYTHITLSGSLDTKLLIVVLPDRRVPNHSDFLL